MFCTLPAAKTVFLDASGNVSLGGNLNVTGDVDVDGTLEADVVTVNGATLNSVIADESTALAIALG